MAEIFGTDAFSPSEIAERIERVGVAKARLPVTALILLGVIAGGFIGLGAMFATLVLADGQFGFSGGRLIAGLVFSMGLLMVVVAGAELFTGNNLMAMAWADGRLGTLEVLRNWVVVYVANFVGAAGLAWLVWMSGHTDLGGGLIAAQALAIARAKCDLPFGEALLRGVLCNMLVCLAIWMAMAGRSVIDKYVALVLPVAAFVAAGFEHSVANMYFIALGMLIAGAAADPNPGWAGLLGNLVPVTLGNLFGGTVLVAGVYWLIYRRGQPPIR